MKPWIIVAILGAAAIVYALMLPKRKADKSSSDKDKIVQEVEATLEQYFADIERENEELVGLIAQMKQEASSKQLAQQEQLVEMRQRIIQLEQQQAQYEARMAALEEGSKHAASQPPQSVPETLGTQGSRAGDESDHNESEASAEEGLEPSIRERYPELFELHAQGKSIEGIAKRVGMQKGEVQLILQLAKQEGSL